MTWANTEDLAIADLAIGGLDPTKYLMMAHREVLAALRRRYDAPETTTPSAEDLETLKLIEGHIATARLLLAVGSDSGDPDADSYPWRLLTEAKAQLEGIAGGTIDLMSFTEPEAGAFTSGVAAKGFNGAPSHMDTFEGLLDSGNGRPRSPWPLAREHPY